MQKTWLAGLLVLVMNGCQPQPPDDTPRTRPPLADDTTPSQADPSQVRDATSDAVNPPLTPQRSDPAPAERSDSAGGGSIDTRGKAASTDPAPEHIDRALAACGSLPADQQALCRERIRTASGRSDPQKRD